MFYNFYDLFTPDRYLVGHEFRTTVRDSWNVNYGPQHDFVVELGISSWIAGIAFSAGNWRSTIRRPAWPEW